jgi:ABC-type Zn2+ transport system substrate-binding protein/surface adhesin
MVFALAFAVPLQGLAAAQAMLCMALGHHNAVTAAAHDHAHHHAADHAHDADSADDHHGGSDTSTANAHCPPCVACCAAAAIVSFAPALVPGAPAAASISSPTPLLFGVELFRLDRPPLAL